MKQEEKDEKDKEAEIKDRNNGGGGSLLKEPIIEVRNLKKIFNLGEEKVHALKGIEIDIMPGEICCIFGTSGSGKSTFLNILAGFDRPTEGYVKILGKKISNMSEKNLALFRQKNLGFVFQSYNLLPFLTAKENVAMPLMFRGMDSRKRISYAEKMLENVGLKERMNHMPSQMSGGQQQRAGIARAFVTKPGVVFADEPTGNLDSESTVSVMNMITDFAEKYRQTIIIVTHDPEMAEYTDRIITLKDGVIVSDVKNERKRKNA